MQTRREFSFSVEKINLELLVHCPCVYYALNRLANTKNILNMHLAIKRRAESIFARKFLAYVVILEVSHCALLVFLLDRKGMAMAHSPAQPRRSVRSSLLSRHYRPTAATPASPTTHALAAAVCSPPPPLPASVRAGRAPARAACSDNRAQVYLSNHRSRLATPADCSAASPFLGSKILYVHPVIFKQKPKPKQKSTARHDTGKKG